MKAAVEVLGREDLHGMVELDGRPYRVGPHRPLAAQVPGEKARADRDLERLGLPPAHRSTPSASLRTAK